MYAHRGVTAMKGMMVSFDLSHWTGHNGISISKAKIARERGGWCVAWDVKRCDRRRRSMEKKVNVTEMERKDEAERD